MQAAFLMNATKVEQVLQACEAGFVLPQKSTYFQPKLATGLVMYRRRAEIAQLPAQMHAAATVADEPRRRSPSTRCSAGA